MTLAEKIFAETVTAAIAGGEPNDVTKAEAEEDRAKLREFARFALEAERCFRLVSAVEKAKARVRIRRSR